MRNPVHNPSARQSAFSLTELMIGMVVGSILIAGVAGMMKSSIGSSKRTMVAGHMEEALGRFGTLIMNDLDKAGSDPRGQTLQAYMVEPVCSGKLIFKYGINPRPADSTCGTPLGDLGILSYVAYDANSDGTLDPEEGIDMVSAVPTLRTNPEDYVVYQFSNNSVIRKNIGDPDSIADDSEAVALENVVSFAVHYHGYDDSGIYGEILDSSRYDDIREVEVAITVHAGAAEEGYINPDLASDSPFVNHRTASRAFRVPLIVRKE